MEKLVDEDLPETVDAETRVQGSGDHHAELRLWLRMLTCTNLIESEIRSLLRTRFDVTLPRSVLSALPPQSPLQST